MTNAYMETFSQRLRQLREQSGKSAGTLSELCGLPRNAISRYERMKCNPSVNALMRIADYFDVSVDYLVRIDVGKSENSIE